VKRFLILASLAAVFVALLVAGVAAAFVLPSHHGKKKAPVHAAKAHVVAKAHVATKSTARKNAAKKNLAKKNVAKKNVAKKNSTTRGGSTHTTASNHTSTPSKPATAATTTTTTTTTDAWQVSAGLSGLFYLSKHDALRTYLSPRWAYTRLSSSPSSTNSAATSAVTGTSGHVNVVSGSFGAQYAISDRFSAFGEVGLAFTRTVSSPLVNSSFVTVGGSTSTNLGTRSGAGVIVYF
jgi:Tfp pilus assembly protein PilE